MANKIHINHVILTGMFTSVAAAFKIHCSWASTFIPQSNQTIDILWNIADMFQDNPTYRMKTSKIVSQLR